MKSDPELLMGMIPRRAASATQEMSRIVRLPARVVPHTPPTCRRIEHRDDRLILRRHGMSSTNQRPHSRDAGPLQGRMTTPDRLVRLPGWAEVIDVVTGERGGWWCSSPSARAWSR